MERVGGEVEAYYDNEYNGPLWSMERIFEIYGLKGEGVLILQDDAVVVPNFREEVEASMVKGECMTYYRHWRNDYAHKQYNKGCHYIKTRFISGVGNYMTRPYIERYMEWAKSNAERGAFESNPSKKGDDVAMSEYNRETNSFFWLTLPNLANHQQVDSILKHPWRMGARSSKEGSMASTVRCSNLYGKKYTREGVGRWDPNRVAVEKST